MATQAPFLVAAYLRVASLAIAGYDYLESAPTAYRFYKEHWEHRRFSISVLLFIAIRTVSIFTLTISSVGFFYEGFTEVTCGRFYLLPPIFKVLQAMVSQAILGVRAFNLSKRSKRVGYLLLAVYFAAAVLQWVTTLHHRTPRLQPGPRGNCRAVNDPATGKLAAWIFYAIAMIYDVGITATSIFYLLKYKRSMKKGSGTVMARVTRMMMYDGLGYLLVLTGTNILNMLLYKTAPDIQTAGSSLGYCVSWIMSQRLLVHLYDASRERDDEGSYAEAVTISQNVGSARDVSRVIRSNFHDRKHGPIPFDHSRPTFEIQPMDPNHQQVVFPEDVGVQVRVERTVRRNRQHRGYELEDYSTRQSRNEITSRVHVGNV